MDLACLEVVVVILCLCMLVCVVELFSCCVVVAVLCCAVHNCLMKYCLQDANPSGLGDESCAGAAVVDIFFSCTLGG